MAVFGRNPKAAIAVHRELLALDQNDTKVLASIAKLELYQGNYDSAKRATSMILKIAPGDDSTILVRNLHLFQELPQSTYSDDC